MKVEDIEVGMVFEHWVDDGRKMALFGSYRVTSVDDKYIGDVCVSCKQDPNKVGKEEYEPVVEWENWLSKEMMRHVPEVVTLKQLEEVWS